MKTLSLTMSMLFCGALLVGCDSEEGPAAPGGADSLPTLSADQQSNESIKETTENMLGDAKGKLKEMSDKASDEVVTQAKALTDKAESIASGIKDSVPALELSDQSFKEFLSSTASKLDEHKSKIATLKSLGDKFANPQLNELITAASGKLAEAQDLYKQIKTVTSAADSKAKMAQLTDILAQVGQLSQQALDQVETLKKALPSAEIPWK